MAPERCDLVVIGGGPGGYVAALRASQLGMKVALVEREHLGGICLNWGCIPTKALLRSAEVFELFRAAPTFGLAAQGVSFDLAAIVARSRDVAARLQAGVRGLLRRQRVNVLEGHGRLAGPRTVAVTASDGTVRELTAPRVILATGARPRALPGLKPDGERIWTYREAMTPAALPSSLLVVGAGAIGVEFASFYRSLGSEVTIVEAADRVLPHEDEEISALARKAFERRGMRVHVGTTVGSLAVGAGGVEAQLDGEAQGAGLRVERVIAAVGIEANVEGLGLEGTAVRLDRGHVVTGPWLETGEPGVYAIGDLAGPPWLAHKASHEAIVCVERIAGVAGVAPLDPRRIPSCTYAHPQVASIGWTERQAREAGRRVRAGTFPFAANGKAIAMGQDEGFVKTVFDADTGELLGAHLIGPDVTELVQGYAAAMGAEGTDAELAHTVFPHPTLSEAMHESVLKGLGRGLHH
jgi:dihydrolipoamide dehydrogenase